MKKFLLIPILLLFFVSNSWALFIQDGGWVDVGDPDNYLTAGLVGNNAEEETWLNDQFGDDVILTKYEGGNFSTFETYDNGHNLVPYIYAMELTAEAPYFYVKTGTNKTGAYNIYLFENDTVELNWGVMNFYNIFVNELELFTAITIGDPPVLEVGFLSHGGGAAPVPEPATMLLLGTGLLGLAGVSRKKLFKK